MDFRILGRFEVDAASGPLDISGAKRRSLLALLVARAGETLTRDRIVDALWDDRASGADHTVQTYISQLRKMMDSDVSIATYGRGYRLDAPRDAIDAFRFLDTARKAADIVDLERRREVLGEALACWRGRALEEFSGAEWADAVSQGLDRKRLEVLEQRIDVDLALGRARELLGELEDLVRTYPFAEPLWAQRMLALYRCGRQADALRAFAELRSLLAEELGIEPSRALADLELRILDQDEALRLPDDARERPVPARGTPNLPAGTVTFLLTDIVSSTEMWESSSDAMAATVRTHEAIIESVIVAHGGHLLKHRGEGDSTLSAFDRAADAMAAAIALQTQLAEKRNTLPLPISIRVALHTGEVEQRDRDYFGRTLNRAARIRALASGDDIMCSRATAELAADSLPGSVSLVELGPQQLRGLHRTEVVFRVVRHGPDATAAPGPGNGVLPDEPPSGARSLPPRLEATLTGPPLVGRRQERSVLEEHWHRGRRGDRQAVFVSGEPGIGKTRLAAEVARIAEADGATILYGHADEGLGVPYQPFVEALRSHVDGCNDDELRRSLGDYPGELVRLLPEIATRVSSLPPPLRSDAATEQYRLFDAVTSWLSTISRRTPLLLVLDDLHDAADPTFLLLRHVASSQHLDALVIATFRQSEPSRVNAPLRLLADLRTALPVGSVEHIELRGLDEADVSEFFEGASGHELDEAAQAFAATLHTHTGGNPFFINEILRNLVETGAIATGSRAFSDVRLGEIRIPAAARDVILRRVARLSDQAQHALTVAAVIGNEFDVDILEAVTGIGDDDLLLALEEALVARLIEERGLERFTFAHAARSSRAVRGADRESQNEAPWARRRCDRTHPRFPG